MSNDINKTVQQANIELTLMENNTEILFIFNAIVQPIGNNGFARKCPRCGSKFVRMFASHRNASIRCTICFWEQNYVIIKRNDNKK